MQLTSTLTLTLSPFLAYAATHSVTVGQNGLTFSPNNIKVTVGDKVDFHFFPKNHSVVASSFAKPCVPIQPDGGIFSDFVPTAAESPNVFEVTVNNTKPIWIYCVQAKYCQSGMSMVVNEPSGPNSLAAYQAAAASVLASSSPFSINGGIFLAGTANSTKANATYTSAGQPGGSSTAGVGASPGGAFTGGASVMRPAVGAAAVGMMGLVMML